MGLTKQYLAYKQYGTFNIIASGRPNVTFITYNKTDGRYVLVGGAEHAIIWDLRLGEKVLQLSRNNQEVTALRASPDRIHIVVGYSDGIIEVFDIETQSSVFQLAAHKGAINILRYDELGMRIISGGQDTEIVIADTLTQTGLYRLSGHNAPITDVHFLNLDDGAAGNVVVSSSKDTQVKFWNLQTQSCFKTLVDNRTEVWALALVGNFIIAGSGENSMNVYRISAKITETSVEESTSSGAPLEGISFDDEDVSSPFNIKNCGLIQRAGKGRCISLINEKTERVLSCHGANDLIENFYFCNVKESAVRLAKRLKKLSTEETSRELSLADEIKRLPSIKVGGKIKSIDTLIGLHDELRVLVNTANNSLKLYSLNIQKKGAEPNLLKTITQSGHQSEVRALSFTSDSLAIASGSAESLKFWNRDTLQCLRTVSTDYVLTCCFAPGDRHVILGMKSGQMIIADISTGEILEEISAHKNELWSICLLHDMTGLVTGSGDTTVKIWHFELIENSQNVPDASGSGENSIQKPKVLSLLHKNTLKLEETVLCLKVSPNGKFLATGLLDSTVKIFFLDTFKFYLSLYGHKLPVLCMDISYDSSIIVTGSADRNVKIWGMDFGDCHKSLFAHDDSVMSLQFIPRTHMFFTCGKDGKIKQWDGDSFEKIITLPGHIGEAYNLSVSPNGKFLVSCGSDRAIRLYERTEEPIVLQDIQEEEREEQENRTLATGDDNAVPTLPGLRLPSRKTVGAEKAAESVIECLDICKNFEEDDTEIHPLMLAYDSKNPNDFLLAVIQRIRASDLEEALIIVPFSYVCEMLERLPQLIEVRKDQTELICKVIFFLFRIHHKPIVSHQMLLPTLSKLIDRMKTVIIEMRDTIGYNLYGLKFLQREIENREGIELFRDATRAKKQREKKNKKRILAKRLYVHTT